MRTSAASSLVAILLLWAAPNLVGQPSSGQMWNLPQGTAVKDSGPRTYRFTVNYNTANTKGETIYRQRVAGEYTRGLPNGEVAWKNVSVTNAAGATAAFPTPKLSDFMEEFHYHNDLGSTMKPDFFKGFPLTAVVERNLVWDTGMLEVYGQKLF